MEIFKGRKLIIATKHKKETIIAKHFEATLGTICEIAPSYDTDELGTFTGEIERTLSPIETVRAKCLNAMNKYGYDLGVANEGSFGPHPTLYFIPADEELMIFIDKTNNIEILVKIISTKTNFSSKNIKTRLELQNFLDQVGYPSHRIILRKEKKSNKNIIKDLTELPEIKNAFDNFIKINGEAYIETDMRAMNNPTRMKIIEETTLLLIEAIQSTCPKCHFPGFTPIQFISGLPCALCSLPTKSIQSKILGCKKCGYELKKEFKKNKPFEDPQFCDYCNP